MSTVKFKKIPSNNLNSFENLLTNWLLNLSLEDIKFFDDILKNNHQLSLSGIRNYKRLLLDDLTLDEDMFFMIFLVISFYYINNNFYSELNNFLSTICWKNTFICDKLDGDIFYNNFIKQILKFKERYKWTDKYCFISRISEWFLYYLSLQEKQKYIISWGIENIRNQTESKLILTIEELKELLNYREDEYYFYNLNNLISYTNYELLFIEDDILKDKYFSLIQNHIDLIDIEKISSIEDSSKLLFISNIYFLKSKLKDIDRFDILKDNLNGIDGLYSFSIFYSWLELSHFTGDFYYFTNDIYLSKLLELENSNLQDDEKFIEKKAILNVLASSCPIKTIRENANCLSEYIILKDVNKLAKNYNSIMLRTHLYYENLYIWLIDKIKKSMGFEQSLLLNKLKNFIIQYLWLEVNIFNLELDVYTDFKLNKNIDISFIKEKGEEEIEYSPNTIVYKWEDYTLFIKVPEIDNFDKNIKDKLDWRQIWTFMNSILEKLKSLSSFLDQIDSKISRVEEKDQETVKHMKRVWEIMAYILGKFPKDSIYNTYIWNLKNIVPVKDDIFFELLWKLHDIWKADTIKSILLYKNTNFRIKWYEVFSILLEQLIDNKEIWQQNETLDKDLDLFTIKRKVYADSDFQKEIHTIFEVLEKDDYTLLVENWFYPRLFIQSAYKLYPKIASLLEWMEIKVLKPSFKKDLSKTLSVKFNLNIDEENVDYFLITLLLILLELWTYQIKEISHPHISHWLNFFKDNKDYSFLSSVLYHHYYPSQKEILEKEWNIWLEKIDLLFWESKDYLDKWDYSKIEPENKNFLMVLTSVSDMLDALLSKRSYQWDYKIWDLNFLNKSLKENIISTLNEEQKPIDKEEQFQKIISYLENDLSWNQYWEDIKKVIIENQKEIIEKYS